MGKRGRQDGLRIARPREAYGLGVRVGTVLLGQEKLLIALLGYSGMLQKQIQPCLRVVLIHSVARRETPATSDRLWPLVRVEDGDACTRCEAMRARGVRR